MMWLRPPVVEHEVSRRFGGQPGSWKAQARLNRQRTKVGLEILNLLFRKAPNRHVDRSPSITESPKASPAWASQPRCFESHFCSTSGKGTASAPLLGPQHAASAGSPGGRGSSLSGGRSTPRSRRGQATAAHPGLPLPAQLQSWGASGGSRQPARGEAHGRRRSCAAAGCWRDSRARCRRSLAPLRAGLDGQVHCRLPWKDKRTLPAPGEFQGPAQVRGVPAYFQPPDAAEWVENGR
ncbi:hypothetical protein AAY473_015833 [Plecturocebus cupreus]